MAAALFFAPGGAFDLYATFAPFSQAHNNAENEYILFDTTTCYTNIKAISRVKDQVIEIFEDDDDDLPAKMWANYVRKRMAVVRTRHRR